MKLYMLTFILVFAMLGVFPFTELAYSIKFQLNVDHIATCDIVMLFYS